MRPDEVLDKAADLFETGQRTWIQRNSQTEAGGACMVHAMYLASGSPNLIRGIDPVGVAIFREAREALAKHVPSGWITVWNDQPERTETEVIEKLREAAKSYREETQV